MKINFLRIYFLLASVSIITGLQAQNLKSLDDNNGFKKYKLGSKFVLGIGVKHKDAEGADKVIIDYANEKIGDIPVKSIELYYLRDTLAKIIVRVPPEYHEKLAEAVKSSFGAPTQDISNNEKVTHDTVALSANYYKNDHIWKTNRLRMEYFYSYPKVSGTYGVRDLYLLYALNDFGQRLQRVRTGVNSAKNF